MLPFLCSGGGTAFKVQPSHFFKRHAEQFIYQETAAVNDRKSCTIYGQVVNGGRGAQNEARGLGWACESL